MKPAVQAFVVAAVCVTVGVTIDNVTGSLFVRAAVILIAATGAAVAVTSALFGSITD